MTTKVVLPPEPQSPTEQREALKRLPAPMPGVVVSVPLALWPLYMNQHGIEPWRYLPPILWVKRRAHGIQRTVAVES